jgi:uncharacterized RDD family membrane protein YckC
MKTDKYWIGQPFRRGKQIMVNCRNCGNELPEGATYCPRCGAAVELAAEINLAFWSDRFFAWLIDMVILGIILGIPRLFTWVAWPGYTWAPSIPNWIPFVDFGLSNVIYFLYWTFMEGTYGQSLGKMVMRIRVVRLNGEHADLGRAALESIGKAFLLPIDLILGWALHPRKRQRIFNYLSETVVVRASR